MAILPYREQADHNDADRQTSLLAGAGTNDPALILGAYHALAVALYYMSDFESARQYATSGVQIWRSARVQFQSQEVDASPVGCLCHEALIEWHFGEIASCQRTITEAISLAKELNDMHGLAVALSFAAVLGHAKGNFTEVERLASESN